MLEVKDVSVSYGRHRALDGVSVKVDKGEICVILGANGAGKSTLLKTVAGMVHAEAGGRIAMNGKPISGMKPHRIVEEGIALVPEGRGIFGDLSVAENLQLGAFASRARRDEAATLALVYKLFPRLAERRTQVARTMSGGEQQMVAIGRALMSKPEILMLDEPSLGLSPLLTQELFRSLREIAATGVGILLVEQNAKQSLKIAGRGYLIENGAVTGENSAAAMMKDPAVVSAYLGGATSGVPARPAVLLPASIRLPVDLGAVGDFFGNLAARAGRIQTAFVRALRQGEQVPSAFVGRYDPKAAGDPWKLAEAEPASPGPRAVRASDDARRVGDLAATLSRRAAERYALHVRTMRLTAPRPSAFSQAISMEAPADRPAASVAAIPASPGRQAEAGAAGTNFEDLAMRAAERAAAHVKARRDAAPPPGAFGGRFPADEVAVGSEPTPVLRMRAPAAAPRKPERAPERGADGARGLIGHNSGDGVLDDAPAAPASDARPDSFAELAARAAERSAAFLRARRQGMSRPGAPAASASTPVPQPAKLAGPQLAHGPEAGNGGKLNGSHGLVDHNSGGVAFDFSSGPQAGAGLSIAELVAHATSVQATHVAEARKRLTAFVIPAATVADEAGRDKSAKKAKAEKAGKHHSKDSAKKKRKKHKEA